MVTKKEFRKQLKLLKRFKDLSQKIDYIEKLLSKKGVVSQETRKALYSELADTYFNRFKEKEPNDRKYGDSELLLKAAENYVTAGELKKARKLLHRKQMYDSGFTKYIKGLGWLGDFIIFRRKNLYDLYPEKAEKIARIIYHKEKTSSRKKSQSLEGKVSVILTLGGFILALSLFSVNFTGYSVANLTQNNSNFIGVIFFILGLVGLYFWTKK